jgi:hypothetical protein
VPIMSANSALYALLQILPNYHRINFHKISDSEPTMLPICHQN